MKQKFAENINNTTINFNKPTIIIKLHIYPTSFNVEKQGIKGCPTPSKIPIQYMNHIYMNRVR